MQYLLSGSNFPSTVTALTFLFFFIIDKQKYSITTEPQSQRFKYATIFCAILKNKQRYIKQPKINFAHKKTPAAGGGAAGV
ncbi:hypothetical protein N5853_08560 [Bartonella sp. HY329]|uniref:hypothetical protein n=1 Tax=unclassified Bartonella TaxID=2645622 RepID=UPI0021C7E069|nr:MULTISPECIES: hypothetical protein [unclassified Bartonella]UXM94166.1 hypothetical protein N5853_08560 [Bartonella sp. HY329]UXN08488.1 hypothetical protein N5852_08570 [Bartonella sp. HY328]